MSHNALKSLGHGFCDAIFATSPIDFDKENTTHGKKKEKSHPGKSSKSQERAQSKNENSTNIVPRRLLLDNETESTNSGTKLSQRGVTGTRTTNISRKPSNTVSYNATTDNKHKTPVKLAPTTLLTNDKTPNVQFCTPKQVRIGGTLSSTQKMNILPANRTPIQRYFSDNTLTQATPDCFNTVQVETPSSKTTDLAMDDQTILEGESSNLTVGVRVRPLNARELSNPKVTSTIQVNGQNIIVDCDSTQHTFMYDHCFISYLDPATPGHANQEVVFTTMVLPLVHNAFEGYNVCLLAYGQTGSGKSYSMMGQECPQADSVSFDDATGIIPRFCQEIFAEISRNTQSKITVEISYFEIYNEKIHDLLTSTSAVGAKRAPLKVREHPSFGPYIVDLSQHCVQNYKDLQSWLKVGNSQRATAATGMNEKSSRSHSIFSIIVTQSQPDDQPGDGPKKPSRRSKINLVDLAGSERLSQTCASGDRLKEGVSINKSLLTLGKVIASLAESTTNRKKGFVPYRESVLTWLLKESLGGNSRTAMLATVSPANIHVDETLATLRYACQARAIVNRIRINEDPHEKLIRELKAEVLRLRGVREGYEKQLGILPRRLLDQIEPTSQSDGEIRKKQQEIDALRDQLRKTEEQLAITQMTWLEKLHETEEKKNSELKFLRRCGIAIEIDFHEKEKQPCLINLAADPMLSGTLLYLIPPGLVRIGKHSGSSMSSNVLDIILDGPLVRPLHCTIENNGGKLVLVPEIDSDTYVNGQAVTGKVRLNHGDRLVIGGNHYFKVSNPCDVQNNIQITEHAVDYEFAHQEILHVQEKKLRAELEESKQKAIKDLVNAKREVELQLGSQKLTYERKIELLGSTVEEQKIALEQMNRTKKELERERELLANEVETNKKIKEIQLEQINVTPYKSNFLQELENILNETTADAEYALNMKASTDAINAGGISLHETQLLVKEATERCREFGISYEFDQQQIIVDKRLKPVIRIRNKERMKETLWEPMRFLEWVHRLRDYDIEDSVKELYDTDDTWDKYEDTEVFEDSLNNSRISINITPVKKHLNESLHQLSMDNSILGNTLIDQTISFIDQQDDIDTCLIQIELATKTLRKLCQKQNGTHKVNAILKKMQNLVNELRNNLVTTDEYKSKDEDINFTNSLNDTVIEKSNSSDHTVTTESLILASSSPTKSTLRNNSEKNANVQKSVRFTNKLKQGLT